MIPERIDSYLREHHLPYTHTTHLRAVSAQRFAAAEHVTGDRCAKPVVVAVDGELALAIVAATQKVDTEELRRALGARRVELAPEPVFAGRFTPCEESGRSRRCGCSGCRSTSTRPSPGRAAS